MKTRTNVIYAALSLLAAAVILLTIACGDLGGNGIFSYNATVTVKSTTSSAITVTRSLTSPSSVLFPLSTQSAIIGGASQTWFLDIAGVNQTFTVTAGGSGKGKQVISGDNVTWTWDGTDLK